MSIIRGTGIDSTVKLYLKGNGANASTNFYDDSQSHKSATAVSNAQISTAQYKFGGSSMLFDGTDDNVALANSSDFYLGNGDWAISAWIYLDSYKDVTGQYGNCIVGSINGTNTSGYAFIVPSTTFFSTAHVLTLFICATRYNPDYQAISGTTTVSLDEWHYVVATRSGGTTRLYLDGVLEQSDTKYEDNNTGEGISVGRAYPGGSTNYYFDGYIDDLIIKNGQAIDGTKVPTRQRG